MTLTRFIFKTHKWLAVGVGLFTFSWFVSGIVMVLPANLFTRVRLPRAEPAPLPFRDVAVSVPQAIAAVDAAADKSVEVTEIGFRQLLGNLYFDIATARDGRHLVSTRDASRLVITEDLARQIAAVADPARGPAEGPERSRREPALAGRRTSPTVSLLTSYDSDYSFGPLPVYRLALEDGRATIVYVSRETGELRFTNRLGRLRGTLAGLHTFDFLHSALSNRSTRLALLFFSALGTLMSVFGLAILCLQLKNWLAMRRAG